MGFGKLVALTPHVRTQSAGCVLIAISLTCGDLVETVTSPTWTQNVRCHVSTALPAKVRTLQNSLLHGQTSKLQSQLLVVLSGGATSSWDVT